MRAAAVGALLLVVLGLAAAGSDAREDELEAIRAVDPEFAARVARALETSGAELQPTQLRAMAEGLRAGGFDKTADRIDALADVRARQLTPTLPEPAEAQPGGARETPASATPEEPSVVPLLPWMERSADTKALQNAANVRLVNAGRRPVNPHGFLDEATCAALRFLGETIDPEFAPAALGAECQAFGAEPGIADESVANRWRLAVVSHDPPKLREIATELGRDGHGVWSASLRSIAEEMEQT